MTAISRSRKGGRRRTGWNWRRRDTSWTGKSPRRTTSASLSPSPGISRNGAARTGTSAASGPKPSLICGPSRNASPPAIFPRRRSCASPPRRVSGSISPGGCSRMDKGMRSCPSSRPRTRNRRSAPTSRNGSRPGRWTKPPSTPSGRPPEESAVRRKSWTGPMPTPTISAVPYRRKRRAHPLSGPWASGRRTFS